MEHGAYNMNVLGVSLDAEYHLRIVLGEKLRGVDRVYSIDLEEVIDDNIQLRYDRKYHTIYFI